MACRQTLNVCIFSKLAAATAACLACAAFIAELPVADRRYLAVHHRLLLRRAADRRSDARADAGQGGAVRGAGAGAHLSVRRPRPTSRPRLIPGDESMKLKLLAALLALAVTPAAAQQRSAPPTARPKLVIVISVDQFSADLFAEYRAILYRRHAAARAGRGLPRRLPVARRDRDLPRPFHHPHRRPPGADRHHRQQLVRPGRGARGQIYLLLRGRARPRLHLRTLHRLRPASARADARRPDAARRSAQPRRRGRRQGPRRGDDGRAQPDQRWWWGGPRLRQPCRRARAGRRSTADQ